MSLLSANPFAAPRSPAPAARGLTRLRIAFITYEYPPDTAVGGIATYTRQAATLLASRGHHVEVFAASPARQGVFEEEGVLVHRIVVKANRSEFPDLAAVAFKRRYDERPFDVLEGPDFGAEAAAAVRLVPEVPFVVKLHMGLFTSLSIEASLLSPLKRWRIRLGAMRRFDRAIWHPKHRLNLPELLHARAADEVVAPSQAIARWMKRAWRLDPNRISVVPNPFAPDPALLSIPVETDSRTIVFLGRLELRKGVVTLADALARCLGRLPDWRAKIIGRSLPSPAPGLDMRPYLLSRMRGFEDRVEFVENVAPVRIADVFASADISVFPSVWDNFPNVCLEAMAAGRAIIGSNAGGMAEQLDGGRVGRLIPARNPQLLSDSIVSLAGAPDVRHALGQAARARVLSQYSINRIGPVLEAAYERAIARRVARSH